MKKSFRSLRAFTLIELLIVIGIVAILGTAVVTVINPVEIIEQTRDTQRLTELKSIDSAISLGKSLNSNLDISVATSTVFISLPDTNSNCSSYATLPALPGGWSYNCVTDANLRKVDGTGWIPLDFASVVTGSPFASLPIDPKNTADGGLYYTYVKGSWELTSCFESNKYTSQYTDTEGCEKITSVSETAGASITPSEVFTRRHPPTPPSGPPSFVTKWDVDGTGDGRFDDPRTLAVDGSGNVYILDGTNNRVKKYTSTGVFVTKWGTLGSDNGQFDRPRGIAIDSGNNVYVSDSGNCRIQKFNSSGIYITQWGTCAGDTDFDGIAVDHSNNVYVADVTNQYIQKFTNNGTFITQWGSPGSGDGEFSFSGNGPLAVDSSNNIYVGEDGNVRVQKFDSNGNFIRIIGEGDFNSTIRGIAVDSANHVSVVHPGGSGNIIRKYTSDGDFIAAWGTRGENDGEFSDYDHPSGIAIFGSGNVYVTQGHSLGVNNLIQEFSEDGTFIRKWGTYATILPAFDPIGIARDSANNFYVADNSNSWIYKYDSAGAYITRWGGYGTGNAQLQYPIDIAIDTSGNVYVTDSGNQRIKKFDSSGNYITKWFVGDPCGIAIDSADNVYVTETGGNQVQKFTSGGTPFSNWGSQGSGDGEFNGELLGIAIDSVNNVYVTDQGNYRIQKFNSSGTFLLTFGRGVRDGSEEFQICTSGCQSGIQGDSDGAFYYPMAIEADRFGKIYVVDADLHRIQKFTNTGTYIAQWGTNGSGNGEFQGPEGIAIDSADNFYITDSGNARIQKFH